MNDFHNYSWEENGLFSKFMDNRLKCFWANIFRNSPDCLPNKIFNYLHGKISEKLLSLDKQNLLQFLDYAFDNISLEIEETETSSEVETN